MTLKAAEVFTPGSYPKRTYVERAGEGLEQKLRDALETKGQVVSIVGPSKSGKTVLVERVVGRDLLIPTTGTGIQGPDELWDRVLDWIEVPHSRSTTTTGSAGVGSFSGGRQAGRTYERTGLAQVVKEIADSEFVVLVDDFQYMPRDVQSEVAKSIKEAARQGVKICCATVVHRGDDLVRSNPELRGRVLAIDIDYWAKDDLETIADLGFKELNLECDSAAIGKFVQESAGSPQLMQLLCLTTCFALGFRAKERRMRPFSFGDGGRAVLEQASATTDFRSLIDVLDSGPRTRGTERKIYNFTDGSAGDVYRCVLKAIAADPPNLSFPYDDLIDRTVATCKGESPVGSSVTGTCVHMSRLAFERFPDERAIEWDEQKQILDIPDPYLLFYLRWSGRLAESDSD